MKGTQWDQITAALRGQTTAATYETVFSRCQPVTFDGQVLEIGFPNSMAAEWAEYRLARIIGRVVRDVCGVGIEVRYVLLASKRSEVVERSDTANEAASGHEAPEERTVEDRRQRFYIIDNVVLDEYLPLMGLKAYAVYSLYCRMAREDLAWPGFDYICRALRIGRSTLSECNKTLQALGLIDVARGDSERSNRYYLLQVQAWSVERARECWERARTLGLGKLVDELGVVLNGDYPSPEPGPGRSSTGTEVVLSGDHPSPERGPEQDPLNNTQEQHPLTKGIRSDAELAETLVALGMARRMAVRLIAKHGRREVLEVTEYARGQPRLRNPAGFIVKRLRDRPQARGDDEAREA